MDNKLTARLKALSRAPRLKSDFVAPPPEARRQTPRTNTNYEGEIRFKNTTRLRCIVKDRSATGLQIEMEFSNTLPDFIEILVPGLELKSTAAVIWQDGQFAGLLLDNTK